MQGDIVWFVFYLISAMLKGCGADSMEDAVLLAVDDINDVLDAHNKVVRNMQAQERAYYYVNTGSPYMGDNQCVLLGMLREDTIYKRIEEHDLRALGISVN